MRVGLIDVDKWDKLDSPKIFPNLPLMKLSAWHKSQGDIVEWYDYRGGHYDKVYMAKVFSFTPDYPYPIDADVIEKGGSGYCIRIEDGKELYDTDSDQPLPYEIEHIMPDYSLYGIENVAYGFCSRGCPRGCSFCHVKSKEGLRSHRVAPLSEFWNGQKYIELCDPNTLACPDWKIILTELAESKAYINFNQGVDIRLMTPEKAEFIRKCRIQKIHFAFDRYEDWNLVAPKLKEFSELTGWGRSKVSVYILCGFKEKRVLQEDLDRIYWVKKECKFQPYVMLYDKEHIPRGHELKRLQRWSNNPFVCWAVPTFDEYLGSIHIKKGSDANAVHAEETPGLSDGVPKNS